MGDKSRDLDELGGLSLLPELCPDSNRDSQELNRVFNFSGGWVVPSVLWEEMHFRLVDRRSPADVPEAPSCSRADFTPNPNERAPSSLPALALRSAEAPVVW